MKTNKSSREVKAFTISAGGLRFAPPVKVKAKRNRVKPDSEPAMLLKAQTATQGDEANLVEVEHAA